MNTLESRISEIEPRNTRVENDKAWETSWTRKISILLMTYAILGLYMKSLGVESWYLESWYLEALVPTGGYLLSTLALPIIRKMWESFYQ